MEKKLFHYWLIIPLLFKRKFVIFNSFIFFCIQQTQLVEPVPSPAFSACSTESLEPGPTPGVLSEDSDTQLPAFSMGSTNLVAEQGVTTREGENDDNKENIKEEDYNQENMTKEDDNQENMTKEEGTFANII